MINEETSSIPISSPSRTPNKKEITQMRSLQNPLSCSPSQKATTEMSTAHCKSDSTPCDNHSDDVERRENSNGSYQHVNTPFCKTPEISPREQLNVYKTPKKVDLQKISHSLSCPELQVTRILLNGKSYDIRQKVHKSFSIPPPPPPSPITPNPKV